MADDGKTRKTTAVKRRPVADQKTVRRPAVARRRAQAPDLTPESFRGARVVNFVERPRLGFAGSDFEFDLGGSVSLVARAKLGLVRGWQYDFVEGDTTLFSMKRGKRWLLLERLTVRSADDEVLATFVQRATGLSVHFEVFDATGALRLELRQPAELWSRFDVSRRGVDVATISRVDRRAGIIETLDATLDELDRLLTLAGAVFVALVYFSPGDE